MFNATNQLTNITNNNLISGSKQWRKADNQLAARSAAREIELQQKLKQTSSSLKDKENGNNLENKKMSSSENINLNEVEIANKKKEFAKCKFYLDNLEANAQASIERGIKLLGASQEKFFSNKCTHLITTKHIPLQENLLQSSCDTNPTKQTRKTDFVPKDTIVENALSWGIVLWSSDVMMKTVDYFMKTSRFQQKNNRRAQEKRGLGKVLQEEKLFGPSTGANSDTQSKRPQFVPFSGHYLMIEDSTQVHRPVIARQYTKVVFTKKQSEYPWPHLKPTEGTRSPFGKRQQPNKTKEEKTKEQQQIKTPPQTSVPAANIYPCTPPTNNVIATPPTTPPVANNLDSQHSLRASGFQPSCTNNTQTASTRSNSVSTMQNELNNRRLPTGEINRLDKRMVENVTQNEHQKMHKQAIKEKLLRENERARKEKGKKKELRYCENCNCQFEKLDEHLNDPTHQTFIRDQNNFSQLDEVLAKTRRQYKSPLPDRWRNLIDTNIDVKNVKFTSDSKRARTSSSNSTAENPNKLTSSLMLNKHTEPPRIANETTTVVENDQSWNKYHNIFLS